MRKIDTITDIDQKMPGFQVFVKNGPSTTIATDATKAEFDIYESFFSTVLTLLELQLHQQRDNELRNGAGGMNTWHQLQLVPNSTR